MTLDTRIRWLKAASIFTIGFGIVFAAAAIPALAAPTALFMDMVFFPLDGAPGIGDPAARLLLAVTGGVLAGWALMVYLVVTEVVPKDPATGRRLILVSLAAWYIVDSSMSFAAGAPVNVASNTVFLLLFVVPAWSLDASGNAVSAGAN